MLVVKTTCPQCGAPLPLEGAERHVICPYCRTSLRVVEPAPGPAPAVEAVRLATDDVPRAEIERLKRMVLDGKRSAAIAHYARLASITPAEAELAVDRLLGPDIMRLLRQMPLGKGAFLHGLIFGGIPAALGWFSLEKVREGAYGFLLLLGIALLLVLYYLRFLIPKLVSTVVFHFGVETRARVVRRAVLRQDAKRGTVVLVLFEVEPQAGGANFLDEETLLCLEASVPKLEPGNILRVRYREPGRERVFPITPIEVVGRA